MNITQTENRALAEVRALLGSAQSALATFGSGDLPPEVASQLIRSALLSLAMAADELRAFGSEFEASFVATRKGRP